jgi:hypothetical protein
VASGDECLKIRPKNLPVGSRYAQLVLQRCENNKRRACRELGISYDSWRRGEESGGSLLRSAFFVALALAGTRADASAIIFTDRDAFNAAVLRKGPGIKEAELQ